MADAYYQYRRRALSDEQDDIVPWLRQELLNVQRGMPSRGVRTVTSATTATTTDDVVLATGTFTVTLPLASQVLGMRLTIKNIGGGVITIGGTVDGVANPTLAALYNSKTMVCDGSAWYTIASI